MSYYPCIKKVSNRKREKCLEQKPEKGKKLAGKSSIQDVCFICDWLTCWPEQREQGRKSASAPPSLCVPLKVSSAASCLCFPAFLNSLIHLGLLPFHRPGCWGVGSEQSRLQLVKECPKKTCKDKTRWQNRSIYFWLIRRALLNFPNVLKWY